MKLNISSECNKHNRQAINFNICFECLCWLGSIVSFSWSRSLFLSNIPKVNNKQKVQCNYNTHAMLRMKLICIQIKNRWYFDSCKGVTNRYTYSTFKHKHKSFLILRWIMRISDLMCYQCLAQKDWKTFAYLCDSHLGCTLWVRHERKCYHNPN